MAAKSYGRAAGQVDRQQEAPQRPVRLRVQRGQLLHAHLAARAAVVPLALDPVERVAVDRPVGALVQDRPLLRGAVAARRQVGQDVRPPALVASRPARPLGAHLVEHLRQRGLDLQRVGQGEPAGGGGRGARRGGVDVEDQPLRPQAVPEAGVDPSLAGPQHGQWLAPGGVDVAQLPLHQLPQQAAPPVGGRHADPGDVRGADRAARHGQLPPERRRVPDVGVAVGHDQRAVGFVQRALEIFGVGFDRAVEDHEHEPRHRVEVVGCPVPQRRHPSCLTEPRVDGEWFARSVPSTGKPGEEQP